MSGYIDIDPTAPNTHATTTANAFHKNDNHSKMKDVSPHFLFDVDELIIISSSSHPSAQMSLDELILFMGGLPAAAGETTTLAGDKKMYSKESDTQFFCDGNNGSTMPFSPPSAASPLRW